MAEDPDDAEITTRIVLTDEAFDELMRDLESPARANPALVRLLRDAPSTGQPR